MDGQLNPGGGGPLVDPDGGTWLMCQRRLDLRVVRRALRSESALVLLGNDCGFELAWVTPDQRASLWEQVRRNYRGPGGDGSGDYDGYEFVNESGVRLFYLEKAC